MSQSKSKIDSQELAVHKVQDMMVRLATGFLDVTKENFRQIADSNFADLSQLFDVDTISIFEYNFKEHVFKRTYFWSSLPIYEVVSKFTFPKTFNLSEKNVKISEINQLANKHPLSLIFNQSDIKNLVTEPIKYSEQCRGFISFENHHELRLWNRFELGIFQMLAQLVSNAIQKSDFLEEIKYLKDEAKLASQAKSEFLYKMSHEIRTPLSGIYNSIYLIGTTNLSIEQKDYLEIGQASADMMSSVIDNVLDISKIESGNMKIFNDTFNLEEELVRIYRVQKPIADDKGLVLDFNFDYRINSELIGDFRKLRQIILNLLSNAIDYTHEGAISLNAHLEKESHLVKIRFDIIDTGVGFDNRNIQRLTEAFTRVDDFDTQIYQGSGLGLAITNQLVHLLGGQIRVSSQLNHGSIFSVELEFEKNGPYLYPFDSKQTALVIFDEDKSSIFTPFIESLGIKVYTLKTIGERRCDLIVFENEIENEQISLEFKDTYGMKHTHVISLFPNVQKKYRSIDLYCEYPLSRHSFYQKILSIANRNIEEISDDILYQSILSGNALIVDDNRLNRIALESILIKEGLKSKSVSTGLKAIEAVQKEDFDIVLMDVQMPGMDGVETTRRIRNLGNKFQDLPIIAVTANAFLSDYDFMKTSQMNDIIFKPIRVKNLNQILRKHIKTTTSLHIPDELFVFDKNDFEHRFEGSFDIALEVVDSFLAEYKKDLDNLSKATINKDTKQLIETAHYFKGSCAYLSGKRAVWLLNYMLDAAKSGNFEMMDKCNDLLMKEVSELLKEIKAYQKHL